ncbi:hypothetical protein BGZ80_000354 [Entomortierella chlamydospora]|uniref:Leucine rich repeat protein n=1 Tax=Entomortierella chlamydospora TaxID=101097 RepID=A0A9P6SYI7_9FUNG|nr:hypothetical protein BGZ80_000354 [Entomortierella chlamydospora]
MAEQQFQSFRLADTIEEVCVRTLNTTAETDDSSFYMSLQDIQDVFPNALRFKLNGHPIPFLADPDVNRIQPWRIAFYRDEILDVITGTPLFSGQNSQGLPLSSTNLVESSDSSLVSRNFKQAEMIKSDLALSLEKHMAESKEYSQEVIQTQKQITTLLLEAKEKDDKVLALQLEAKEKDDKMILMQNQMLDLQNQALDRLAILQKHAHAILVQNFELHEYPIPRLFIILPVDQSKWNPTKILENKFRFHFLCECGDHTVEASKSSQNQIHIAKHEGYEIRNGTEFFRKYGKYMLILMRALKMGMQSVSISVPHIPIQQLLDAGIEFSISYMEALSVEYPGLNSFNTIDDYEGLEGADLRQLGTFLQINDQDRKLGNLYRITIETGHVKWVCIDHFRSTYKEKEQMAFADTVAVNGGNYDSQLGRVTIELRSRIRAEEFFNALAKARHVYDLDITFPSDCTRTDLEAFEKALKKSSVSVLRLDLQLFQASTASKLFSTSTRYEILVRIMEHTSMKMIHIVLSKDFIKLHNLQPKRSAHLHKLSFEMALESVGSSDLQAFVNSFKANATLTILNLSHNWIGKEGAQALSEALKTNTTLTTLNLAFNKIGYVRAQALSEALKTSRCVTYF